MEKSTRTRRHASAAIDTLKPKSVRDQDMKQRKQLELGKTNEKMAIKGRKRSQEDPPGNIEKKQKLKADADNGSKTVLESFSPRRSSRTSIPNSRYKDMEEAIPGRKSKSGLAKEKVKVKKGKGYTIVEVEKSAAESESEDIVTEEIPIDTSQAMDAIASSNSASVSIIDNEVEVQVSDSQAPQEMEILPDCGNEFDSVKAHGDCVTVENEKPSPIPVSIPSISPKDEAVKPKIIVYDPMNEDNSSGSVKSVLLERESEKNKVRISKGRVLEIDASSHLRMSNVCTGQVVHVPTIKSRKLISSKETEVSEMTEGSIEEKYDSGLIECETLETVTKNPLLQPGDRDKQVETEEQVTSINDNVQNIDCDVEKGVINMEDKEFHNPPSRDKPVLTHMRSVSTNDHNDDNGTSTTLSSAPSNDTNVTLGLSVVVSTENSISIQSIKTDKTDIHKGIILTTRDNSMKEEDKTTDLEEATVTVMTESDQLISDTEVPETGMHSRIEMVQTGTIYSDIGLADSEEMEVVNATVDSENPEFIALPIVEEPYTEEVMDKELFVDKDLETVNINKDLETDNSIRESKTVQNNKEVQNSKVALHNAFVEIIEYGRLKKQIPVPHKMTESGFDYIMFGENLVQIRRPQKLHGRIQPVKEVDADSNLSNAGPLEYVVIQPPKEKTSEETDSEDGSSMTKADPTDPAGNQLSVLKPEMLVGPMQPLPVKTKQFAPHGHIVRADPNARPTDVVEISEDIFEKEIYRENQDTEADKELGESPLVISTLEPDTEQQSTPIPEESSPTTSKLTQVSDDKELIDAEHHDNTIVIGEIIAGAGDIATQHSAEPNAKQPVSITVPCSVQTNKYLGGKIIVVDKDYFKNRKIESRFRKSNETLSDKAGSDKSLPALSIRVLPEVRAITADNATVDGETEVVSDGTNTGENGTNMGENDGTNMGENASEFNGNGESKEGYENFDNGRESEHGDPKVVIKSGNKSPVYKQGQKLVTEGTQTPLVARSIYGGMEEEGGVKTTVRSVSVNTDECLGLTQTEKPHTEEYIIVHLPPGTEVTKTEVRKPMDYKQYHESEITMLENGQFICVDCNYVTDKKSNWFKHRRKHLGIRPHQCPMCHYKAATSSNLKRHIAIHEDIRNFICPLCAMAFRQKIHLERHLKYRHEEKRVKCPLCEYTCANENPDLKIHIKRRHMPLPDGSVLPFTCEECGIMTVSKKDLRQHKKFHKKGPELKLFCEFCSFVTDCDSRLKRHMYIHTKEKPFQCGLCAYRATQKEHVLRHMKSQHDIEVMKKRKISLLQPKEKENETESIESDSEDKGPFEQADYSSKDRIFACNHCTMRFAKLINLYKHLYAQHKALMPDPSVSDYQCVVCEFRTNNKKNLLVHMRKHNMQDQTPPTHVYSCVLCRYINPRRKNLFQHMKKKHGIEIMVKEDGTTNCYLSNDHSPVVLGREEGDTNVVSLSDIVTTHTLDDDTIEDDSDNAIQIITEDNIIPSENMSMENVIRIEDMSSYVVNSYPNSSSQDMVLEASSVDTVSNSQVKTHTVFASSIVEHEAAEAIEGLQALAQQAGLLESQTVTTVDASDIVTTEIMDEEEIKLEGEIKLSQQDVMSEHQEVMSEQVKGVTEETEDGIQLSSEQLNQLTTGDYVEIDGEVYKVEISPSSQALTK